MGSLCCRAWGKFLPLALLHCLPAKADPTQRTQDPRRASQSIGSSCTCKAFSTAVGAATSPQTPPRHCPYRNTAVLSHQPQLRLPQHHSAPQDHTTSVSLSAQQPLPLTHRSINSFSPLAEKKRLGLIRWKLISAFAPISLSTTRKKSQ